MFYTFLSANPPFNIGINISIVIGLLILFAAIAFLLVKFQGVKLGRNFNKSSMKIIDKLHLGPGQTIFTVEVQQKEYLIGSTQNRITFLKELPKNQSKQASRESDK